MNPSHGKIGTREMFSIIIIIIGIKGADITPAMLFPKGENATWMFPIIWILVMLFPMLALLSLLKHYKNKHLIDIIYHLTGKYIGFLISLFLFVLLLTSLVLNSRSYVDIMNTMIFPNTPIVVLLATLIGTSCYIARGGFESIGRIAWLLLPYLFTAVIFLMLLIGKKSIYQYLFPIAGPGILEVLKNGISNSTLIGEFLLMAVFFPNTVDYKSFRTANLFGFGLACLGISLFLAEYVMLFDYRAPQKMMHAFSQMSRLTSIGIFITNLDAFFYSLWALTGLIRFAFYLHGCAAIYGYTVHLKNYKPLILPFAVLTVIIGLIPGNPVITTLVLRENFFITKTWIFFLTLPIGLWSIAHIRGEYNNENV